VTIGPAEFNNLASSLSLPEHDVMLVGDGSGTRLGEACGWYVAYLDRRTGECSSCGGSGSTGTNNFAELAPYVQALWAIDARDKLAKKPVRVQIVTDSEVTARCGSGQYTRNANGCLWSAVDWFVRSGYLLNWNWVARNSNPISCLCDEESGRLRRLLQQGYFHGNRSSAGG